MINTQGYIAIEQNLRWVSGQIRPIAKKEVADKLVSAEHILSVVRSYSQTLNDRSPEDRAELLEGLFSALYR